MALFGLTNGRFTLYFNITPVLLQEMQVSYIMFPEMVIYSLTHFGLNDHCRQCFNHYFILQVVYHYNLHFPHLKTGFACLCGILLLRMELACTGGRRGASKWEIHTNEAALSDLLVWSGVYASCTKNIDVIEQGL